MMEHRRRSVALFEDPLRFLKAALDIAPLELVFEKKVAAFLLMQQGRAWTERLTAVVNVRQRLIADVDEIDRLPGRAQTFRGDNGDDFAVEPDFVDSDERLIFGQLEMLVSRQRPQGMEVAQMISVQDADNAGESLR